MHRSSQSLRNPNPTALEALSSGTYDFPILHPNAAGIDVGASEHWVALPPRHNENPKRFDAFTDSLIELAQWLVAKGVDTVAMESTGVYWIPLYDVLESHGIAVYLVHAQYIKSLPGRKTDVVDCVWIQRLHSVGLLSAAFRPNEQIRRVRSLFRHRTILVKQLSTEILRMQKALSEMNIKLQHAVSDIAGKTGMRIVRAILEGERNPQKLATLRDKRCKNSEALIARSLQGTWQPEHIFVLGQSVSLYDFLQTQVVATDREIEASLKLLRIGQEQQTASQPSANVPKKTKKSNGKNAPHFDSHKIGVELLGVDLTKIPGFDGLLTLNFISEVGLSLNEWRSEKHFTSWMNLCPSNNISGGKRRKGKAKKGGSRVGQLFRIAAQAVANSKSAIGAYYRRMRARLGPAQANRATAHKLARIVYNMVKNKREYVEMGQQQYEEKHRERVLASLKRKAKKLGFNLIEDNTLPKESIKG